VEVNCVEMVVSVDVDAVLLEEGLDVFLRFFYEIIVPVFVGEEI